MPVEDVHTLLRQRQLITGNAVNCRLSSSAVISTCLVPLAVHVLPLSGINRTPGMSTLSAIASPNFKSSNAYDPNKKDMLAIGRDRLKLSGRWCAALVPCAATVRCARRMCGSMTFLARMFPRLRQMSR
jgi:hypothetical protein